MLKWLCKQKDKNLRKRYRARGAEIGKSRPRKEPIKLLNSLQCPIGKNKFDYLVIIQWYVLQCQPHSQGLLSLAQVGHVSRKKVGCDKNNGREV